MVVHLAQAAVLMLVVPRVPTPATHLVDSLVKVIVRFLVVFTAQANLLRPSLTNISNVHRRC